MGKSQTCQRCHNFTSKKVRINNMCKQPNKIYNLLHRVNRQPYKYYWRRRIYIHFYMQHANCNYKLLGIYTHGKIQYLTKEHTRSSHWSIAVHPIRANLAISKIYFSRVLARNNEAIVWMAQNWKYFLRQPH